MDTLIKKEGRIFRTVSLILLNLGCVVILAIGYTGDNTSLANKIIFTFLVVILFSILIYVTLTEE